MRFDAWSGAPMRTDVDASMAEAQQASGQAIKQPTVEDALGLMIELRRQQERDAAFGKYRWRGDLARSRKSGRGVIVVNGVFGRPSRRPHCAAHGPHQGQLRCRRPAEGATA
jgi:hypothetical protein